MKFLADNKRTLDALNNWVPNPIILSSFFWGAGNVDQRSIDGLLCSLLHQLLKAEPGLGPQLLTRYPEWTDRATYHDWSNKELETALFLAWDLPTRTASLSSLLPAAEAGIQGSMQTMHF
ncbi:hypothetical protein N657DRAFT_42816 [Parathielavia appendiculata]|uniref:Uncharacterized protein n=1 Tax=Parathielavia appendiculata TaxID=2587402 RepID=A0AAN6U992_9PEZI|nr:hypothetical protein N657DRAFT_42816 [Parathielavia appendiculata]